MGKNSSFTRKNDLDNFAGDSQVAEEVFEKNKSKMLTNNIEEHNKEFDQLSPKIKPKNIQ